MDDHVELDLPLTARYATTVRAVAASIASSAGLSVDDIDDLRLGVNEAISVLTDLDPDEMVSDESRLHVRFTAADGEIAVAASRRGVSATAPAPELDVLARRIMQAVVDEFDVDDAGVVTLRKRLRTDERS